MNNKDGRLKEIATKKKKYGDDYYKEIGARGGKKSKGRKKSKATKLKISETQRIRHHLVEQGYNSAEIKEMLNARDT